MMSDLARVMSEILSHRQRNRPSIASNPLSNNSTWLTLITRELILSRGRAHCWPISRPIRYATNSMSRHIVLSIDGITAVPSYVPDVSIHFLFFIVGDLVSGP